MSRQGPVVKPKSPWDGVTTECPGSHSSAVHFWRNPRTNICRLHMPHLTRFVPAVSCFWQGTSSSGYIEWSKTWFTRLHPWRRQVSQLAFSVVNGFLICHALKSSTCSAKEWEKTMNTVRCSEQSLPCTTTRNIQRAYDNPMNRELGAFLHSTLVFMMSFFTPFQ